MPLVQDGVNLELAVRRQLQAHSRMWDVGCGCDLAAWNHNEPDMGVSENREHPIVPNGFADHYPYEKWLFHWEY